MKNNDFPVGTEIICIQLCQWRNRRFKPGDRTMVRAGEIVPDYFEAVAVVPVALAGNAWADLGKWNKRRLDDFRAFIEEQADDFKTAPADIQAKAKEKWDKLSAGKAWPLDFKKKAVTL